jgi:hypothetical protein
MLPEPLVQAANRDRSAIRSRTGEAVDDLLNEAGESEGIEYGLETVSE